MSLIGYDFGWIYLVLFAFLLVFGFLTNPTIGTKEIDSTFLQDSLLANKEIEKIVVLNEELALVYIKKDLLKDSGHKAIINGIFGSETGPHYSMDIESDKNFENKLQNAQQEFILGDKIEIHNENPTNWFKLFSWILPIVGVLILFLILWPTIKRKVRQ